MAGSTSSDRPEGARRPRRWLARLAVAAAFLVGLALVLALGALAYLATPSGGDWLRNVVVERANAALEGSLAVRKLSLRGGHLVLEGVELRDPEDSLVARVSALEVRLRLAPLVRKRIELGLVRLDRPEIHLVQDQSGTNLQRALAGRNPSPEPEQNGEESSLGFVLQDLDITHGVIDVVQRSADGTRHIRLDDVVTHGSARMLGDALGARLEVVANFAAPLERPFHLSLEVSGVGERRDARLALEVGAARLVATARMQDERHADVRIDSLVLPHEIAQAFASSYPLRAVVSLSAAARRNGDELSLRLDAKAASATARMDADFDLTAKRTRRTAVTIRHVDLSELTEEGPSSDMALDLVASGGGTSLDDLVGRVELAVPPSPMAGDTMGPVQLLATAEGGEVQLPRLLVHVPGVRLEARGRASKKHLAVGGTLVASELAAFSRTLGKLGGTTGLVKGQGRLDLAVGGSPEHPAVKADGSFPVLVYQQSRVDGLALHVDVPDLKVPTRAKARVTARKLALAPGKVFRGVRLEVNGQVQELTVDAAVHGYAELALRAEATVSQDGRSGTLHALSLRYPEARWTLAAPAKIESRPRVLSLSPLHLRSGEQSIVATVLARGARLDTFLAVRSLDLGRLPKAFVDPALALGGVLDLQVSAKGRSSSPDVTAKIVLRGGRFKKYRNVELRVDGSYARNQARGTLAADGEGMKLTGAFDLPVRALQQGRHDVPVKLDLEIAEFRLDESLQALGLEKPVSGLVSAQVSLRGAAGEPRLEIALRGRGLRFKELGPSDVVLALQSADGGRLEARADLTIQGKQSFLEVRTPFTLGELIRKPPSRAALLAAEFTLEAEVRELPLKLLSEAGVSGPPLEGTLSARAHVAGTAMSPRGAVSVSGRGLATSGLEPIDARIRLQAGKDVSADVRAEQGGKAVLTAKARLGVDPRRLGDVARLAQAPLSVEASVGPLSLSDVQAATQPADVDPARAPPRIRGTLAGRLAVSGTLRDPRVVLRAKVDGLGAERNPDGQVALAFDYANVKETLELTLRSRNEGELRAKASAQVDLSYPAVTMARRLDAAPLQATLVAKDFDPAFLSSLTGAVEKAGGLLYADARVSGTMGSPAVKGRLEWKDGLLFTHGNGDFTSIHLLAIGDNDRLELEELTAKSGGGTLKLSALATRTGVDAFKLHAAADLDKLPVMSQGQVVATLSIRSTAEGDTSPAKVSIKRLDIREAHVQLPEVQRKDLQKLDDPPDVVLTVRGKPVRGTKENSSGAEGGASGVAPASSASSRPETQVTVLVNAPRNLWIKGSDVNMELGLSNGFRIEYATEPKVFGAVNVIRGRLDVFGRRFDVQRDSKVSFTGPAIQPDLDVTAAYKNELEQVTVKLNVQGQAEKLQLKPTSEPPLSETEIYTLLATGHTSLQHGTGASSPSGEAASLVGSAAATQLKKTLSSRLPLDVLSIQAGDSGIEGSKLEAGTYVNDRFYVGFKGRIGADPMRGENSNEVNLEYQLSKRWSLNGSYGDAHAGGAGVTWRKEY